MKFFVRTYMLSPGNQEQAKAIEALSERPTKLPHHAHQMCNNQQQLFFRICFVGIMLHVLGCFIIVSQ